MSVVVITGGSGGIGLALCREFCARGDRVYTLSRTQNLQNPAVHLAVDVTDEASVAAAFSQIAEPQIDLLINNAGFGISGAVEFAALSEAKAQFDVNFFGALRCIQAALPKLRAGRGRIVNVSSAAAVFAIPFQAFYSASKSALNALTLALRNELKDFGITVCAVMPGDVKTNFTAERRKSNAGSALYANRIEASVRVMERDEQNGMSPVATARSIRRIAEKRAPRPFYTIGAQYRIFSACQKLLPLRFVNWMVGKLYLKNEN